MFRIGEFSRLTQVTVKALRHYDRLGLLTPAHTDPFTGYRSYSAAQLPRLNRILALKDFGLSLEQIAPLLDVDLSAEQLRALLLSKQGEVRRRLQEEEARLARIEARLRQIDGAGGSTYDVIVKCSAATRVAALRRILPDRPSIAELFRQLRTYQQRHGLTATSWMAIWHDPDFRESGVDAEATFASPDFLPPDELIQPRDLPAVETLACVVHHGPTNTIGRACMALLTWVEMNGYRVAGPERVRGIEHREHAGQDSIVELQLPVARDEVSAQDPAVRRTKEQ